METETSRLSKVSKVIKGVTEKYVRQRTMLGMQLEQMVAMLEESIKDERLQLVRATCRSIGSLVESVNTSLRESCKAADMAILNLVNYMKNMVLVGLPLVDSSLFAIHPTSVGTGGSQLFSEKLENKVFQGHNTGSALGLKRVFEEVKVFVKECETLQRLLQQHETQSSEC